MVDVPLRNFSLPHSLTVISYPVGVICVTAVNPGGCRKWL